jgi:5-methylcytosine-specific restriction protein A
MGVDHQPDTDTLTGDLICLWAGCALRYEPKQWILETGGLSEMPGNYTVSHLERWREPDLDEYLAKLCPTARSRRLICKRIVETIRRANSLNSRIWGVTKTAWGMRVNVGRLEAISWSREAVGIMVDFKAASSRTVRNDLNRLRQGSGHYASAPDSQYVWSETDDAQRLAAFMGLVEAPHRSHLSIAAATGINGATPKGHHPGLVDAIAREAGAHLPQPSYVAARRPDGVDVPEPPSDADGALPATAAPAAYVEGGLSSVERNPAARTACIAHDGVACGVCGVVLERVYGRAARDLIQVHHVTQLSSRKGRRKVDPVLDLRPVCPNCHAVIHRYPEPYTIEQVRAMLL